MEFARGIESYLCELCEIKIKEGRVIISLINLFENDKN